jgi:hypothetical protein
MVDGACVCVVSEVRGGKGKVCGESLLACCLFLFRGRRGGMAGEGRRSEEVRSPEKRGEGRRSMLARQGEHDKQGRREEGRKVKIQRRELGGRRGGGMGGFIRTGEGISSYTYTYTALEI